MKKILLCFFLSAVGISLSAQSNNEVTEAVASMTSLYNLDAQQVEKMHVIQERRFKNLAEIAHMENSDRNKYLQKLSAIRQGTDASVRMMLNKVQMETFKQKQADRRIAESEIIKELKAKGLTSDEIRLSVIERLNG